MPARTEPSEATSGTGTPRGRHYLLAGLPFILVFMAVAVLVLASLFAAPAGRLPAALWPVIGFIWLGGAVLAVVMLVWCLRQRMAKRLTTLAAAAVAFYGVTIALALMLALPGEIPGMFTAPNAPAATSR